MNLMYLIIPFILNGFSAFVCARIGHAKGYDRVLSGVLGFMVGPFGILVAAVLPVKLVSDDTNTAYFDGALAREDGLRAVSQGLGATLIFGVVSAIVVWGMAEAGGAAQGIAVVPVLLTLGGAARAYIGVVMMITGRHYNSMTIDHKSWLVLGWAALVGLAVLGVVVFFFGGIPPEFFGIR